MAEFNYGYFCCISFVSIRGAFDNLDLWKRR